MPGDADIAAVVFAATGGLVALLGAYIRVARRVDLLANYDGTTDPDYAARHAGTAIAATGLVLVGYAVVQYAWRLPEATVVPLALVVTAGALWAAARAQGY